MPNKDLEKQKRYDKERYQRLREKNLARAKEYRLNNVQKVRATQRAYYLAHKEEFKEYNCNKKEAVRARVLPKIGWTLESYTKAFEDQKGLCFICGRSTKRLLAADHDHTTMQPRKLLCANCNAALGLLQDSSEVASKAADYLRKFGK